MENIRYTKGELVVYGTNGICIVDDIQKMAFPMETEEHTYYVLRPVGNKNSTNMYRKWQKTKRMLNLR